MVDEAQTRCASEEEATRPVTPPKTSDEGGEDKAHHKDEWDIVSVLPTDNVALGQIGNVRDAGLATGLDEHPADVRPEETFMRVVRVQLSVGVAMMGAMATRPPLDGALDGANTRQGKKILEGLARVVRPVRPETVITRSDT